MRRIVSRIHDDTLGADPWHDFGWKLYKRFSDRRITPERIRAAAEGYAAKQAELTPDARVTLTNGGQMLSTWS